MNARRWASLARTGQIAARAASTLAQAKAARAAELARASRNADAGVPTAMDLNVQTLRAAAERLDIAVERLPGGFLKLTRGEEVSYAYGSNLAFEPLVPFFACGDKWLTATRLQELGLPVPRCALFGLTQYEQGLRFFRELGRPAVTKPARSTHGGAGVTVGIGSAREFRSGFAKAAAHRGDVLVEEHLAGENVRVTVLAGRVLGAVHRLPAAVTGDGASTVAALAEAKNALWRSRSPENRLLRPIQIDRDVDRILARAGLDRQSVPAAGQTVRLRDVCNADQGGEIADVTDALHPGHRELALAAARAMGPTLCGVDLMVDDPARPGRAVINEVNTTPSLYVINGMRDGSPSSEAAEAILRHLFSLRD